MNLLHPPRLDALARDYALGTMAGGARRRFERLLRGSPAAEMAVLAWQQRLGTLAAPVPPLEPREQVWAGLERQLFPAAAAPSREPWWRVLFGGRSIGGALAGVLLAVVLLREQPGWLGLEPVRDALPASYVGLLHDGAGKPVLLASSRRHGTALTVKLLQPLTVPAGRVAVLWALPKDGGAPFAVGTLPGQGSGTVALAAPAEKLFFHVTRLGVSIEPGPGAAQPSGAFVLSGDCVKLW